MKLVVTKAHQDAAKSAGAYYIPEIGAPITDLQQEHVLWFLDHCPEFDELHEGIPVWALTDSGCGHGDGDGYGDSFGNGYGWGDGYDCGYGSGSGFGDG